jgi:fused signal recognition particle receptor
MKSLFGKLKDGLQKTRRQLSDNVHKVLTGRDRVDEEMLEDLEDVLLAGDVGLPTTEALLDRLRERIRSDKLTTGAEVETALAEEVETILVAGEGEDAGTAGSPHVVLLVGVNGTGKTTTLGKLAHHHARDGKKVVVAAADTFRAAAVDQLRVWAERAGVELIANAEGTDPAAVAFDAVNAGKARGADIVFVDTAGRLQTKVNLMEELRKIGRVVDKAHPGAPHEVLLVLDATTGQNAIQQAEKFGEAIEITGLVLTKVDGTAKGGVVVAISHRLGIPVRYLGLGEGIDDLEPFDARSFARALFRAGDEADAEV